jgi:hypothetical protein
MKSNTFRKLFFLCSILSISLATLAQSTKVLNWQFPITRTHTGMLLGNSTQGLMVWGTDTLNITVGHNGFWDHRGGNDFSTRITYPEFKSLVEKQDEATLMKAFNNVSTDGLPIRPQHLSAGIVKVAFPKNYKLVSGNVDLHKGIVFVKLLNPQKKLIELTIQESVNQPLAWINLPAELVGKVQVVLFPMYKYNVEALQKRKISPPEIWGDSKISGFTQSLPKDAPLSMLMKNHGKKISIATLVGYESKAVVKSLTSSFNPVIESKIASEWWKAYWAKVSDVKLDDKVLQEIVDYGLYKQACMTSPNGPAATLQGAFMEEYQLPPWSNDYHFNINAQLIYMPALASNTPENFKPMITMLDSLIPVFKKYGQNFFLNKNAMLIPHAVDDRGQVIGNFVTGTIDHATTAWVAHMLWQHYQYTGDRETLKRVTYPLMKGAFEGFNSMLEETKDANGAARLSMPVSVSPEWGSRLEGIGKNSSFQLAALHKILQTLPEVSKLLNEPVNPRWSYVQSNLPLYTTIKTPYGDSKSNTPSRIALWEGQDLEISHRHHSHLASIYPFDILNPFDPEHREIYRNSMSRWLVTGTGAWTGWSMGWAATIYSRMGKPEEAVSTLHNWRNYYVNEGRGTLHNAVNSAISVFNETKWAKEPGKKNHEIIQMDANFGALTAVLDLLVQERFGTVHVLPNKHVNWKDVSFKRIRTPGGFLISAQLKNNVIESVQVESTLGGVMKLSPNLGKRFTVDGILQEGPAIQLDIPRNKIVLLKAVK